MISQQLIIDISKHKDAEEFNTLFNQFMRYPATWDLVKKIICALNTKDPALDLIKKISSKEIRAIFQKITGKPVTKILHFNPKDCDPSHHAFLAFMVLLGNKLDDFINKIVNHLHQHKLAFFLEKVVFPQIISPKELLRDNLIAVDNIAATVVAATQLFWGVEKSLAFDKAIDTPEQRILQHFQKYAQQVNQFMLAQKAGLQNATQLFNIILLTMTLVSFIEEECKAPILKLALAFLCVGGYQLAKPFVNWRLTIEKTRAELLKSFATISMIDTSFIPKPPAATPQPQSYPHSGAPETKLATTKSNASSFVIFNWILHGANKLGTLFGTNQTIPTPVVAEIIIRWPMNEMKSCQDSKDEIAMPLSKAFKQQNKTYWFAFFNDQAIKGADNTTRSEYKEGIEKGKLVTRPRGQSGIMQFDWTEGAATFHWKLKEVTVGRRLLGQELPPKQFGDITAYMVDFNFHHRTGPKH